MKKLLLGMLFSLVLLPAAHAVDLFPRALTSSIAWNGLYVGGLVGYGWGTSDPTVNGVGSLLSFDTGGATVGAKVGYDHRFGNMVAGVAADWSWANIRGSATNAGITAGTKVDQLATIRARVGFLPFDPLLIYVTGGAAGGHVSADLSAAGLALALGQTEYRWGWTVGAGLEYALSRNWFVNAEYLYADMGHVGIDGFFGTATSPLRIDTFRVGVAYRF